MKTTLSLNMAKLTTKTNTIKMKIALHIHIPAKTTIILDKYMVLLNGAKIQITWYFIKC